MPQSSHSDARSVVPEVPKLDAFIGAAVDLLKHPTQDILYEIKKLRGYRNALFEHYAPFRIGDHICLTKDVRIGSGSGWRGYEAMMVKGATAKIVSVDWLEMNDEGRWVIDVMFDKEFRDGSDSTSSRYHYANGERHTFCFHRPEREWEKFDLTDVIYAAA